MISPAFTFWITLFAGLLVGFVLLCALVLFSISLSLQKLCYFNRRTILDEVKLYAATHDKVSMADVMRVIGGMQ